MRRNAEHAKRISSKDWKEAFTDGWLMWASVPGLAEFDQHKPYRSAFQEMLDDLNVASDVVPRGAHFKLARTERRVQTVKTMAEPIIRERDATTADGVFEIARSAGR